MRFIPAILIILILALFTFGIGAVYFATRLTPEVFQLNLETAKLKAEAERLKAEQALVETNVQAQIEIQNLHTDQEIKASWGYRYSLAFAKSFLNLWVVWVLLSVVGVLLNQRHRWTPQVVFVARGIKTMIPAKKAVELVREAMSIEELEVSQKMIAAEAEVSRDRFHDTMSAARMIKGLIPKESPIKPSEPIDITPAAIPAHVPSTFSMSDLLVDPDLERGHLPLGRNAASGGCVQVAPEFATSFDIVGKPNHCKTTILEMLTLGFLKLQDEGKLVDLYLIDPHAGFKGSLALFLQPVLHRFTKTVLGEQAIEEGQHLNLLQQFEQEAGKRQTHGYNEPLQVLIIDEIHDLLDQDGGKEAYMSLKKLRRLRKAGHWEEANQAGYFTRTQLKKQGKLVKAKQTPVAYINCNYGGRFALYHIEQTKARRVLTDEERYALRARFEKNLAKCECRNCYGVFKSRQSAHSGSRP